MTRAEAAAAKRILAKADAVMPLVRKYVELALHELRGSISLEALERALAQGDLATLYSLVESLPMRLRPAARVLEATYADAARAEFAQVAKLGTITARFNAVDPYMVAAARAYIGTLVREIADETRRSIRSVVARAFTEGIPPRDLAKLIKPLVGLTTWQARSVERLRADLIGEGLSRPKAAIKAAQYAEKVLKRRALTIARTETIAAANQGSLEAWRLGQKLGYLRTAAKKWIVAHDDRLCPRCRALDGKQQPLNGKFTEATGNAVDGPPLHPNCRCSLGIVSQPKTAGQRRAA